MGPNFDSIESFVTYLRIQQTVKCVTYVQHSRSSTLFESSVLTIWGIETFFKIFHLNPYHKMILEVLVGLFSKCRRNEKSSFIFWNGVSHLFFYLEGLLCSKFLCQSALQNRYATINSCQFIWKLKMYGKFLEDLQRLFKVLPQKVIKMAKQLQSHQEKYWPKKLPNSLRYLFFFIFRIEL